MPKKELTTPEKMAEYAESKRVRDTEKRKLLSEAKKNGTLSERRMGFMIDILDTMKLNWNQLSKITGISQQTFSWWLVQDDTKLSHIMKCFEKLSMTITPSFVKDEEPHSVKENKSFNLEIDGELPVFKKTKTERSDVLDRAIERNARLAFLASYIKASSPSLIDFCQKNDFKNQTMYRIFNGDDMRLSQIYDIAEKSGAKVNWRVRTHESMKKGSLL